MSPNRDALPQVNHLFRPDRLVALNLPKPYPLRLNICWVTSFSGGYSFTREG